MSGPTPVFHAQIDDSGSPIFDQPERFTRWLDRLKGQRVSFTVRKYKRGRSLSQNRRLWAIYTAIAEWSGHEPEEIHEALKQMFLSRRFLELPNETMLEAEPTTTTLDIETFGDYITRVEVWATQQGCELPNWEEYAR